MKFGVREICDVVFKAKTAGKLGTYQYTVGQPVLFIDSAKTSTIEGAATTVYAQGGRGNSNLITWEGEKTLTFTVEDALLSPIGFAILSGAGLLNATGDKKVYVHQTATGVAETVTPTVGDAFTGIDLTEALGSDTFSATSPVFAVKLNQGSFTGSIFTGATLVTESGKKYLKFSGASVPTVGDTVFVDYYIEKASGVYQLEIEAGKFAGYWYVEGSTLFRRQEDGEDLPAEIIFPNVKIQSNFTFTMASTGDPSTFTFTMDAMPGYTRFDRTKKVLCAIQIVDESAAAGATGTDSAGNTADGDKQYPVS